MAWPHKGLIPIRSSGIAYVDPGNLEADLQIGAQFGALAVWRGGIFGVPKCRFFVYPTWYQNVDLMCGIYGIIIHNYTYKFFLPNMSLGFAEDDLFFLQREIQYLGNL